MFKIGDFSKLSFVPVKTLRYYDELGLLKPGEVDPYTGYRYYSAKQLPTLNRILVLKDLGLSLKQIGLLINHAPSAEEISGMLRRRRTELEQHVQDENERLARVEARLLQIEQEGKMPEYDVVLKKVPAMVVASYRGNAPAYNQQGHLWEVLERELQLNRITPNGACFSLYHDTEYRDHDVDVEVCEPVAAGAVLNGKASVKELPEVESMACVIHHGPFSTLPQAYQALMEWIQTNGYRICGPDREIYLETGKGPVHQNDPSYVTEVQMPVEKVK